MDKTLLLVTVVVFSQFAHAQKHGKEFYDKNDIITDSAHSHYYKLGKMGEFIRKSNPFHGVSITSGKVEVHFLDSVVSYYTWSGKIRSKEIYQDGVLNGSYTLYHENGRVREKGLYYHGERAGYFTSWYPEGKVQRTVLYDLKKQRLAMINYWDSLGRQLVNNGNGLCKCYAHIGDGKVMREVGRLVDGLKDSIWLGYINDTLSFRETYKLGEFIEGVRYFALVKEFYDKSNKVTDSAHSYYYKLGKKGKIKKRLTGLVEVSVIGPKAELSFLDTVISYYTGSGKIRSREIYKEGVLSGSFTSYHENGRVWEKGLYYQGERAGYFTTWYPEGRVQRTAQYSPKTRNEAIINYWDSVGKQLVNNGKGFCRCYEETGDGKILKDVGKVVEGLKDSIWLGYINDTLSYKDNYKHGDFLSGVRYFGRKEYRYKSFEEAPAFPGGFGMMIQFINTNMRYPRQAQRMGTEGTVVVGFVVNKDGTLSDIKILKGITAEVDQEALRIVKLMQQWNPGRQHGLPVTVLFQLPIIFKLSN